MDARHFLPERAVWPDAQCACAEPLCAHLCRRSRAFQVKTQVLELEKTNEWRDQSKLQILRRMNFFKRMGLPNEIVFFCSPTYIPIPFRCIPDSTLTYQLLGVSFKYVIYIIDFSSIRVSLTLSCPMNLKLYPLDRQMCPMQIASCKQSNFKTFKLKDGCYDDDDDQMVGQQMTSSTFGRRRTQYRLASTKLPTCSFYHSIYIK